MKKMSFPDWGNLTTPNKLSKSSIIFKTSRRPSMYQCPRRRDHNRDLKLAIRTSTAKAVAMTKRRARRISGAIGNQKEITALFCTVFLRVWAVSTWKSIASIHWRKISICVRSNHSSLPSSYSWPCGATSRQSEHKTHSQNWRERHKSSTIM